MSSSAELPFNNLLRDVIHVDTLNVAFVENGANFMYDMHRKPFEELECRAVISSMVQESVFKGFLKAFEEDLNTQLTDKEKQIEDLKGQLKQKDAIISEVKKLGLTKSAENADVSTTKTVWDFLEESKKKWKQSEDDVMIKEKELERMAFRMVQMASMLENEMVMAQHGTRRLNELDRQLAELKEQETIRIGQIAALQQENGKLRIDNSRFKRQALVKERQFKDNMAYMKEEIQQKQLMLEKLAQEKQVLETSLKEKEEAFSHLRNDYGCLESQVRSANEAVRTLVMERNDIQGIVDEQKLMQELMITYVDQEIEEMRKKFRFCVHDGNESLQQQQSSWKHRFSASIGEDESVADSVDGITESIWKADTGTTIFELVIDGWYTEVQEMLHKLTFEVTWKDEVILKYGQQLQSHKQTIEELENDYATLMSICLALLRDQNDNDIGEEPTSVPAHEFGRRKLMELSELLSSQDASAEQAEQSNVDFQFEEQISWDEPKSTAISDILDEETSTAVQCAIDSSTFQEKKTFMTFEMEENYFSQQCGRMLELEIISEILMQTYKESVSMGFHSIAFPDKLQDQNDNNTGKEPISVPAHEFGKRSLMELGNLLSSRDASGGQAKQSDVDFQFKEQHSWIGPKCMVISDILDEETSTAVQCSRDLSTFQENKALTTFEMEEKYCIQQCGRILELEIISEILMQKYKELLCMGSISKEFPDKLQGRNDNDTGEEPTSIPAHEETSAAVQCTIDLLTFEEKKTFTTFEMEEKYFSQQSGRMLELEIISEILMQKYEESLCMGFNSKALPYNDRDMVENIVLKYFNNFEDLEVQIESFLELETSRLQRMRSICSTSIANCEFKLGNLTNRLADQVNEMKTKFSFAQETIKEQEWKHMMQEDIFLWVLSDTLMPRRQNMEDSTPRALSIATRASKLSVNSSYYLDLIDTSPKVTEDHQVKLPDEGKISSYIKVPESPSGIQDKDKLIRTLKTLIEDLRREKTVVEQKLDAITEEVYSLKRQFWKEKEIWVSKLSQPQRRDIEAQVEALSRHSPKSRVFDDELKKVEMEMFEDLVSESKKEWLLEQEKLLQIISRKEAEMENLMMELSQFRRREQSCYAKQSELLEEISGLTIQIDNLSNKILDKEFHFTKCKELWHAERQCMKRELQKLLEKEKAHIASSQRLSGRIAELEKLLEKSRLDILEQESSFMMSKREWRNEMEDLRGQVTELLETEHAPDALEGQFSGRIAELEAEMDKVRAEKLSAVSSFKELETKRDHLKGNVEFLLRREQAYAVLQGHLLANLLEFECRLETSRLDRIDQENSFLILRKVQKSEVEDLNRQITQLLEKEHACAALRESLSSRIAELEAEIDSACVEKVSAMSSSQVLQTERDDLKGELEILLQRELAYAVLEGHLLANILELEGRLETVNLERVTEESSFSMSESVWQAEREDLRRQISEFLEKEYAMAALHGHLSCRIKELEAQIDIERLEKLDALSYFEKVQTERDILKSEAAISLQREEAYAVLEGHLLANLGELEYKLETSNLERMAEKSSFLLLGREWQMEREDLRRQVSKLLEKEAALQGHLSGKIAELESQIDTACREKHKAASYLKELETEKENHRVEVEILLQKEQAYAVLEGHLLANLAELQCRIESSDLVLEREWKAQREHLRGQVSELLEKERAQAALQVQLLSRIVELEEQIDVEHHEKLKTESRFEELKIERDNLKGGVDILLQREQAYAVLEGYLLGNLAELESKIEISHLERVADESAFLISEKLLEGEEQNLREPGHAALPDHPSDRIAELEAQVGISCLERHNALSSYQELVTERDDHKREVEILLQRESNYAVLEGHLLANIADLEILIETSRLQRSDEESSLLIFQQELQNERDNLRGVVRDLIQKEDAYAVLEGHLLGTVVELEVEKEGSRQTKDDQEFLFMSLKRDWENEIRRLTAETKELVQRESGWSATIANLEKELEQSRIASLDQVSSLRTLKQDWESERTVLKREIEMLLETEHSHVLSLGHFSVKIAEMEAEVEAARSAKFDQELLLSKFKMESETDKERLVARIKKLEDEIESSNLVKLDDESSHIQIQQGYMSEKCLATSSSEREQTMENLLLVCEKEISNSETNIRLELEKDQKHKTSDPKTSLGTVPKLVEQFDRFLQFSQEVEKKVVEILHTRSLSLDRIERNCRFLKGRIKSFTAIEANYKQKLAKELSNLQKAETEVDLLGDEVEALLGILEEVQSAFDIYAPVLHHYPKMVEVAKLVRHEIQLRIDPKYGA